MVLQTSFDSQQPPISPGLSLRMNVRQTFGKPLLHDFAISKMVIIFLTIMMYSANVGAVGLISTVTYPGMYTRHSNDDLDDDDLDNN